MTQAATGAVNTFSDLPAPIGAATFGLVALSGAGLGVLGIAGTLIPRVREMRTELSELGRAGEMANRGFGLVGRGGAYAVGFLALAEGVHALAVARDQAISAKPKIDALTTSLVELAKGSGSWKEVADLARGSQESIKKWVDLLANADQRANAKSALEDKLDDLDKSLSNMVKSGAPELASKALRAVAEALGVQPKDLRPFLNDYSGALDSARASAAVAGEAQKEFGGSLGDVADPAH